MAPEDMPKTAFNCCYGSFEWHVMPFGLTNVPSTFKCLMNHVLFDSLDSCMLVYLDDVLIYSRMHEEHVHRVREVFSHLRDHQLYLKPSKCTFLAPHIKFLGHTLSAAGVEVDANKTKVIDKWPQPTYMHDV